MDYSIWDDERLIRAVVSADAGALGALYDRYGRLVYSLAIHILGDGSQAEEVTQDVFIQLWHKADTYHPDQGKLVGWLARIARNRAIDLLRHRSVRPEGHQTSLDEAFSTERDPADGLEDQVEQGQERWVLLEAISHLPEQQRSVLSLAYFQGLSQQEIAEATHEPLGTVKTRLRLAMQKLRQAFSEDRISAK